MLHHGTKEESENPLSPEDMKTCLCIRVYNMSVREWQQKPLKDFPRVPGASVCVQRRVRTICWGKVKAPTHAGAEVFTQLTRYEIHKKSKQDGGGWWPTGNGVFGLENKDVVVIWRIHNLAFLQLGRAETHAVNPVWWRKGCIAWNCTMKARLQNHLCLSLWQLTGRGNVTAMFIGFNRCSSRFQRQLRQTRLFRRATVGTSDGEHRSSEHQKKVLYVPNYWVTICLS